MDTVRHLLLTTLLGLCAVTHCQAEIRLFVESPERDVTATGIGLISGWAVSDDEIESIQIFYDGVDLGAIPYGGSRPDVGAAFPEFPNSDQSGWAVKWNFGNSEPGLHAIEVVATTRDGETQRTVREFETTRFQLAFIPETRSLDLSAATINHNGPEQIAVFDAELDGETVDFLLQWNTGSQQYLISEISYPGSTASTNTPPSVNAGSDHTVNAGDSVTVSGSATDSDGSITDWRWQQVGGSNVSLSGSNTSTVRFNAPAVSTEIVLALTVTDDQGASSTDRVRIQVTAPAAPSNQPPVANAGPDQTVETGSDVVVQGSASDSDGSISNWSWRQLSGPTVALTGSSSRTVRFTAPEAATSIVLQLTATDDDGATDSDQLRVNVSPPDTDVEGELLNSMLSAINQARSGAHTCSGETSPRGPLPPLLWSNALGTAALGHSMDMAVNDFFSHTGSNGSSMADRLWPVWSGSRISETLAASSNDRSDAAIVQGWLDSSSGHCQIIMSGELTHLGVGKAWNNSVSSGLQYYWTADFGG